ncbi:MAG: hypothetical protein FD151_925 [bacterium]|nr:MAG: hypothetical protein FD151_925 [bacterium]
MTDDNRAEVLRWRPHHIYCEPFLAGNFPDRGERFDRIGDKIRETMQSGTDTIIEVIEGVDELCQTCPLCQNNGCQSPNGDEDAVRKWDAIVLKGLGVSYGEKRSAQEFRALIEEKAPLEFCRTRCRWKDACTVFG